MIRWLSWLCVLAACAAGAASAGGTAQAQATGPLRVSHANPRYFTDGSGKAVYLTGSHTWGNLADSHEHPPFDFAAYLDFLGRYQHNFIRLWSGWDLGPAPIPYERTGPGAALDGQPRVDLTRLDPRYFDRLRARVLAARDRGIYAGIMLFSADGAKKKDWTNLFLNPANNLQGVNADTNGDGSGAEAYDGSIPPITSLQEAYVRKVIDAVNDLDNVLYEIGNEGDLSSAPWQHHFIRFIKECERGKPKQHPVGMTAVFNILDGSWTPDDRVLWDSPADWISPALNAYKDNPPAADGRKVVLADVDHIWPAPPHAGWIWKCFLRGLQPILMDWHTYGPPTWTSAAEQEAMRQQMGYALVYARKMNLAAMTPRNDLAGTGYCLANPGAEYLIYQPAPQRPFTAELAAGTYQGEWFHPREGRAAATVVVAAADGPRSFTAPFAGDAVLYLVKSAAPAKDASLALGAASPAPIQLHPENPRYFRWRGKPTVLITSGEHYGAVLNRDFDHARYLLELESHKFNLTRVFSGTYREVPGSFRITGNTLAPAEGAFLCPWARGATPGAADAGNKFDLTQWDEAYFARLKDFARQAGRRGVVVELVLFCTMYDDAVWSASPMNARNNVNGIGAVGRGEVYGGVNKELLAIQSAVTRKLVTELNPFDNVYYEICNEPYERGGLTREWNDSIIAAIVDTEKALPTKHLIAQGFPPAPAPVAGLHPHVSILNFHAAKPDTVRLNLGLKKVIAFDETGGADTADWRYRAEGWAFVLAGGGVYDHLDFSFTPGHEDGTAVPLPPGTPGGGGPELRRQLGVLKSFIEKFDFIRMAPDERAVKSSRITGSEKAAIGVLSEPGKAYAIHVNGGTQAELALELPAGAYTAQWLDTKTGASEAAEKFKHAGGAKTLVSPPYSEDIALRVVRAEAGSKKPAEGAEAKLSIWTNDHDATKVVWQLRDAPLPDRRAGQAGQVYEIAQ